MKKLIDNADLVIGYLGVLAMFGLFLIGIM
jgi:hypothetical protein